MAKTARMERCLDAIFQQMFKQSYSNKAACSRCGSTKVAPSDFHDDLSRREFEISHFCQKCQDKGFDAMVV